MDSIYLNDYWRFQVKTPTLISPITNSDDNLDSRVTGLTMAPISRVFFRTDAEESSSRDALDDIVDPVLGKTSSSPL